MRTTLLNLIIQVWGNLGEPTNLDPYAPNGLDIDITTVGFRTIRNALNLGQQAVAFYKSPRTGRQHRWKNGYVDASYRSSPISTIVSFPENTAPNQFIVTSDINPQGMYVQVDGNFYQVLHAEVGAETGTFNVYLANNHSLLRTDPDAIVDEDDPSFDPTIVLPYEGKLCVNYVSINDTDYAEILKVGPAIGEPFERSTRSTEFGLGVPLTAGIPTQWYRRNKRLYFDTVLVEDFFFKVTAIKPPTPLIDQEDTMEIAPQLEWAVVLWALGWGYGFKQELDVKQQMQADFHAFMLMTQTEDDVFFNLDDEMSAGIRVN